MKLIDLTRINQLIDGLLDKINEKYATKAELNSGLKGKAEANHGTHLTLGTTQNNAYRGDYGNVAYQHSQAAHAPSNAQKNSDITKAEIEAKLTGTISSHTHSDIYSPTSHNHTSLTGITSLTFAANSDDSSIIKITKDSATSYTDFVMSDDAGSDMWRWRFKAWDSSISGMTAEYDLMTLKATSTTKGQLSVNGNVTADSFTEGGTALSSKYAAASHGTHVSYGGNGSATTVSRSDHTHSYLPLSGGTMTGDIKFTDVTSTTYPAKSAMLTWNGSTDGADIYYQVDANDKGRLVLNTRDDADCIIAFANKGTIISTIDNSGNFSGKAAKADTLNTARTLTIGNTGKTFNGSANVSWSLSEIGAAAASSVGTLSSLQTSAKGNLVAAINELFQNANNGKQLIASAIGEPLDSNDTFSAMSTDINNLVSSFKANLKTAGVTVNDTDKFKQLIDKTKNLSAGGIKIDCVSTLPGTVVENQIVIITSNKPSTKEIKDYSNCTPTSNGQIIIGVSTTNASSAMIPYSITTNGVVLTLYLAIAKGQFNNTIETYDGYIGRNGEWLQFSVGGHILYANGYDAIGFTATDQWSLSENMYISSTSPTLEFKMKAYSGGWLDEYAYFRDSIDLTNVSRVRIVGSYTDNGGNSSAGVGFVKSSSFGMAYPEWEVEINLTGTVKEVITDVSSLKGNHYFGTVNRSAGSVKKALKITEFELIY